MGPARPSRPYYMDLIHFTVDFINRFAIDSRARFGVMQHEPALWENIFFCGVMSLSPFLRQCSPYLRTSVGRSRCFPTVCLAAPWQLCRGIQELTPKCPGFTRTTSRLSKWSDSIMSARLTLHTPLTAHGSCTFLSIICRGAASAISP
jgi:hypothetical protein